MKARVDVALQRNICFGKSRRGNHEVAVFAHINRDDMHLGDTPHKMMAQEISEDIAGNFSDAWVRPNL
jgi:hypothetical protein